MPVSDSPIRKAITLRLSQILYRDLKVVADVDGQDVVETIRIAVAEYIQRRKHDPIFRDRLEDHVEAMRKLIGK